MLIYNDTSRGRYIITLREITTEEIKKMNKCHERIIAPDVCME